MVVEEAPTRRVVIFGAGSQHAGRAGISIRRDTEYHCVDRPPYLGDWTPPSNVHYHEHDLLTGPTPSVDGFADEVHLPNLLSDARFLQGKDERAHKVLLEALRILKPRGRVIVGHILTPDEFGMDKLRAFAKQHGLAVRVLAKSPDSFTTPRDDLFIDQFVAGIYTSSKMQDRGAFVATLRRTPFPRDPKRPHPEIVERER